MVQPWVPNLSSIPVILTIILGHVDRDNHLETIAFSQLDEKYWDANCLFMLLRFLALLDYAFLRTMMPSFVLEGLNIE